MKTTWRHSAALLMMLASASCFGQVANVFQAGGALGGTWNSQIVNFANTGFFSGTLPAANQQSVPSPNFLCNNSGATGAAGPCNPLAASTMMSAVLAVDVVATANLTLSGLQTIDGQVLSAGQFVLAQAQTTTSQNGIYVVSSGAWTRAANFPAGYVIAQNCEIVISVRLGTNFAGSLWYIPTSSAITIGTTGFTPTGVTQNASNTRLGLVRIGGTVGSAVEMTVGQPTNSGDCAGFNVGSSTVYAQIEDAGDANGNQGNCAVMNAASGHLILDNNGNTGPSASVGTLYPDSTDHWGHVSALSTATSVTITFASTWTDIPSCMADTSQAATPVSVSAASATAVTFSFASLTGTLYYTCLGLK